MDLIVCTKIIEGSINNHQASSMEVMDGLRTVVDNCGGAVNEDIKIIKIQLFGGGSTETSSNLSKSDTDILLTVETTSVMAHEEASFQVARRIGGRVVTTTSGRAIIHLDQDQEVSLLSTDLQHEPGWREVSQALSLKMVLHYNIKRKNRRFRILSALLKVSTPSSPPYSGSLDYNSFFFFFFSRSFIVISLFSIL